MIKNLNYFAKNCKIVCIIQISTWVGNTDLIHFSNEDPPSKLLCIINETELLHSESFGRKSEVEIGWGRRMASDLLTSLVKDQVTPNFKTLLGRIQLYLNHVQTDEKIENRCSILQKKIKKG